MRGAARGEGGGRRGERGERRDPLPRTPTVRYIRNRPRQRPRARATRRAPLSARAPGAGHYDMEAAKRAARDGARSSRGERPCSTPTFARGGRAPRARPQPSVARTTSVRRHGDCVAPSCAKSHAAGERRRSFNSRGRRRHVRAHARLQGVAGACRRVRGVLTMAGVGMPVIDRMSLPTSLLEAAEKPAGR